MLAMPRARGSWSAVMNRGDAGLRLPPSLLSYGGQVGSNPPGLPRLASDSSARDVMAKTGRDEETALRSNKETLTRRAMARGIFHPRGPSLDDRVGVDQELSRAGDQCQFVLFALCDQTGIEGHQRLVPAEGGRQRRSVQGLAQAATATGDLALPL